MICIPDSVYYHDQATGWLHLKITQEDDRRIGGQFTDKDGNTWTVADSPNIIFDLADDLEVNYPSIWNFNMPKGSHFVYVNLDYGNIKGSSDPSHFIFEINVGMSRIRHTTTLKLNDDF